MTHTPADLVTQAAALFLSDTDAVVEIRALHTRRGTQSGYYTEPAALVRDALQLDGKGAGVYVTLNPVDPRLLARAVNRCREYARSTTTDDDIVRRVWVLFDCDPVRPTDISSTDGEHEAALAMAHRIAIWLITLGVPPDALVVADSGNGGHVLMRVSLPNDADTLGLIKRVLAAVDFEWSNETVKIDTGVDNAARIGRLYGTTACKGDSIADRPHRRSRLLTIPTVIVPAPLEVIQRLAARAPVVEPAEPPRAGTRAPFDVVGFVHAHLQVQRIRQRPDGATVYVIDCPWRGHDDGAAFVMRRADGAIAAGCLHNSCREERWSTLRPLFDSAAGRAADRGDSEQPVPALQCVELHELLQMPLPAREVVLSPWLPERGLAMIYANRGDGKTFFALSCALAIAAGSSFARFNAPRARRVLYIDGEMTLELMQERLAHLVAGLKVSIEPGQLRLLCADLQPDGIPDLSTRTGQDTIRPFVDDADVIVFDNCSTLFGALKENENDAWLYAQQYLLSLRRQDKSAVLIHHAGRNGNARGGSRREDVLNTVIKLKRDTEETAGDLQIMVTYEKSRGFYGPAAQPFQLALTTDQRGVAVWTIRDAEDVHQQRVFELKAAGLSQQKIAETVGISQSKVSRILNAA